MGHAGRPKAKPRLQNQHYKREKSQIEKCGQPRKKQVIQPPPINTDVGIDGMTLHYFASDLTCIFYKDNGSDESMDPNDGNEPGTPEYQSFEGRLNSLFLLLA